MTPEEIEEFLKRRRGQLEGAGYGAGTAPSGAAPLTTLTPSLSAPSAKLFPKVEKQTSEAFDTYFRAKTGKVREQVVAELQNDVTIAPDFQTYAALSKALNEIERDFKPGEVIEFVGARPVKSGDMKIGGLFRPPAPSAIPLNVRGSKITDTVSEAFKPQIVSGPVVAELEKVTATDRARKLLSDERFAESLKDKSPDEIATARENLEASRAAVTKIIDTLGSDASDEDVIGQFKIEMEDLGPRLEGKSKRDMPATLKSEPGKAPNIAAAIYGRQTAAGEVPNLTGAQSAYLEKYYGTAFPRLKAKAESELKGKLESADIPDYGEITETDVAAGGAPPMTMRKRTPSEVQQALTAQLPAKVAELQAPWWTTDKRDEIIRNPEKFATGGGFFETKYPTGATKEGFGAYALRMAMSPINIASTALGAVAARTGEAAARLTLTGKDADRAAKIPSVMESARQSKGGKAADLPEGFIGDLAQSVMYNRGGAQVVGDIYKELGLNENLGVGLGFALDILAPPLFGAASSTVAGGKAFRAARGARAAGLIGAEGAWSAGGKAAGNALLDAWTWRRVLGGRGGTIVPSSIKLLAADETGKILTLREELRILSSDLGRPLTENDVVDAVARFAASNEGGGKFVREFAEAAKNGRAVDLAEDLIDPAGRYFSGSTKISKVVDDINDAVKARNFAKLSNVSETLQRAIIRNAAARSDAAANAVLNAGDVDISKLLNAVANADPLAVRRSIGAVISYDAFNQIQAAKGFAEFPDLVLISNRFIGDPAAATEAAKLARQTELGATITAITRNAEVSTVAATPRMLEINPQRAVQVINVDAQDARYLASKIDTFERTGMMSKLDADYARALLPQGSISVPGLRYLAEANIDSVISARGFGIETAGIRAAPGGAQKIASQVIARDRIFTPPQMRSFFDGILLRTRALFDDGKLAAQILDLPPQTTRAVGDFYAEVGKIDSKIKSTLASLRAQNPELRVAYGLPPTGPVSESEALTALIRGQSDADAQAFINEVTNIALGGYKDTGNFKDLWMSRSFFTTNTETYITAAGRQSLDAAQELAVAALRGGADGALPVVQRFIAEVQSIVADPANTTASYRLASKATVKEADVPKVIGGALFGRETDIVAKATKAKVTLDDALVAIEQLVPVAARNVIGEFSILNIADSVAGILGKTADEIVAGLRNSSGTGLGDLSGQKLLIAGAIKARQAGYAGTDGLVRGMVESLGIEGLAVDTAIAKIIDDLRVSNPRFIDVLDSHAPAYFSAADQSILRARVNGDNVDDVIDVLFSQSRGVGDLPRSLVTGQLVDDAINTFVKEETFGPIMQAVIKDLPRNSGALQRATAAFSDALQFIGNVRYNAFLYLRPNYHVMNIVSAPLILHATLGIEGAPLFPDFYHATRAMQSSTAPAVAAGTVAGGIVGAGLGPVAGVAAGTAVGGAVKRIAGAADNTIAFIDKAGRPFTYADLRELGVGSGLFKTEQQVLFSKGSLDAVIEEAERLRVPQRVKQTILSPASWPADWANSTDNFWRMSSFIKALREGKPVTVAQEIGKKSLFDFGSLTAAERAFASRFLIFYTFSRVAAEQLVKTLGNPASAARFVKQAAVTRDIGKMVYEHAGGEEYDVRRFYMKDRDLARAFWPSEKVGLNEYLKFTPSAPSVDSFMQIAGILYARNPGEVVAGAETGIFQFLDPLLKEIIAIAPEEGEAKRRADRLRLLDPKHVAALTATQTLPLFTSVFGDLTPIEPGKETAITYNDSEWQLSPDGYRLYKEFTRWAQVAGLMSTVNYYGQLGVEAPGRGTVPKMLGFGAQERPSPEAQEQSVLEMQAQAVSEREKLRKEQDALRVKKEIRGAR